MEILRVPPYPITTTWTLPVADYLYTVYVEDLVDHSTQTTQISSNSEGILTYDIELEDAKTDRKLLVRFYDTDQVNVIYEENLDIIRPYVNPNTLGSTASEIAEHKMNEVIARAIIDTYANDGFYNKKFVYEVQGNGSDYIPIWKDINHVLKVYENNVLVYDINTPETNAFNFVVTDDRTAIVKEFTGLNNNIVSAQAITPIGRGDWVYDARNYGTFLKGFDYKFVLDEGMKTLPSDIEAAAKMLIDDISCGKLDYYKRYITSYNTDQFRIQFDKSILNGTGNLMVDRILDKHIKSITKLGVL